MSEDGEKSIQAKVADIGKRNDDNLNGGLASAYGGGVGMPDIRVAEQAQHNPGENTQERKE
jgi:hypothetical protein